jgi:uncharacterized protein
MKIFDKLFEGGEEDIVKGSEEIIGIARQANRELLKLVNGSSRDINPIKALEKESDRKVFQLQQKITSGAVSPNVIDDMLKLIDLEDSIVDSIYNLARELVRYDLPDQKAKALLQSSMASTIEMVEGALAALQKMTASSDISSIRACRADIEALEQKEDDIKDSLLDYVYRDGNDYKSFHHINEVAHKADDILDNCEDASDMFLSIMLSVMS